MIVFIAAALLGAAAPAFAQEGEAEAQPKDPRWNAAIDLSFSGAGGNQQLLLLDTGFQIAHLNTDLFEMEWSGRTRYGRSEGRVVVRNLRGGLKFDLYPNAMWSPFVFSTAERDPFRKLEVRASGGAGVKRTLWRAEAGEVSLSTAALYFYEDNGAAAVGDPYQQSARTSWRLKARRSIASNAQVEHTSYYQPIWDEPGDYLMDIQSILRVRLGNGASLTLSHSLERDSTPLPDVKKDDHLVKAGLTLQTRW